MCSSLFFGILIIFLGAQVGFIRGGEAADVVLNRSNFAQRRGTHFVMNGRPIYLNGFNAYWLMYMAADPATRTKVSGTLRQASSIKYGMNVVRTWAFSDGGYRPLQCSPGVYDEDMLKGLDFVISEAKKNGVFLILSLVNNWKDFGGKSQYVQWARDKGHFMNNDDDFFTNSVLKGYFKNHIKAILTRINSITGIPYKDEPTIFAWELMNEPRCESDLSGNSFQGWVEEMAAYVKSIDANHLLQIGLEGFYGESMPEKRAFNPGYQVGTDFIANNKVLEIDFAAIHLYPDPWVGSNETAKTQFTQRWIRAHIEDSNFVLGKPFVLSEFGKSSQSPGYQVAVRDTYFSNIYNIIYSCARNPAGACGGALFWQVVAEGMENFSDGYEVVLEEDHSTAAVIAQQSKRLSSL